MGVNEVGESSSSSFFQEEQKEKQRARKRQIYSHLLSLEEVTKADQDRVRGCSSSGLCSPH